MKFTADIMLGKLTKWLRLLGFDTFYDANIEKDRLIHNVISDDRTLLTRNTQLIKMRILRDRSFLIKSDLYKEQLVEVLRHFNLCRAIQPFSRCLLCNEELIEVNKEDVEEKVPPYVFSTQESFSTCLHCKRIFWSATHVQHASEEIKNFLNKL